MSHQIVKNAEKTEEDGQIKSPGPDIRILICGGRNGCNPAQQTAVKNTLVAEVDKRKLSGKVEIVETGCNGFCEMGPTMIVRPAGIFYVKVTSEDIPELVEEQIIKNQPVERLFFEDPVSKKKIAKHQDVVRERSSRMTRLISGHNP
jgi:(2Fe-2S) ferredoxin